MSSIKIHVLHTGKVCIAPDLAFGGDHCNIVQASGLFTPEKDRIWLPVSAYLIEHPARMFLVDTGWARSMSPNGTIDKQAQIESLGSHILYRVNQGYVPLGACVDEQLEAMGVAVSDLDAVLLTHLDCDHANGLDQVRDAKKFLVSADELHFANELMSHTRYHRKWWANVDLTRLHGTTPKAPSAAPTTCLATGLFN